MRIFFIAVYIVLLVGSVKADGGDDKPIWRLRDPEAWSAVYKYCIACHDAKILDGAVLSDALWKERIYKCTLHMASRGYPMPTKKDREALEKFLPDILPADRKPPVYLARPPRGGKAVP